MNLKKIQTGDVANCFPRKKLLSRLISKVSKGDFSHTAIFIVLDGIVFVADSQISGFTLKTYDEWVNRYGYEYIVSRGGSNSKKDILALCGIKYDFEGLFVRHPRKYWIRFTNRFRKALGMNLKSEWKHRPNEGKRMTCSEAIMRIKGAEGWESMSPQEAWDYQMKNKYKIILTKLNK